MITIRCEQCGQEFQAQRRSAKFCSGLCRQHRRRGHPPVVSPLTFWKRFSDAFEDAEALALTTDEPQVAVFILVTDDDGELLEQWEFYEFPEPPEIPPEPVLRRRK